MFMNRVHEQCPKIDSGTLPSQNGSKKKGRVHRVHSPRPGREPRPRAQRPGRAPAAQPALPRALRARPRLLPRPAHLQHTRSPSVRCAQLPPARPARALCAQHLPSAHASCHNTAGVLRYTLPSSHCPSCCVTIQFLCIKTQPLSPLAFLLQYSCLYVCNTNHCIATQKLLYQPSKPLSCNTNFFFPQYKLGSSPETVLHYFFSL